MRYIYLCLFLAACGYKKVENRPENLDITPTMSFYDLSATTIEGDSVAFDKYKGKKLLIVNTASECGFTPQYEDLQTLHRTHGDQITILGFPSNDFGGQEPGSDAEIAAFCENNFNVQFQMFSKVKVKGEGQASVYDWLTDKNKNGWNESAPGWNFCKYLIDEHGALQGVYGSAISPMSEEILDQL